MNSTQSHDDCQGIGACSRSYSVNSTGEPEHLTAQVPRPYPTYKDSGLVWLGAVPTHWEVRQLGRIGRFFKGNGGTKDDDAEHGVACIRYGDLYTRHRFFIIESRACVAPDTAAAVYTPLQFGDVLFAGSGETLGEIGKSAVNLIPGPACCGGDVIIFRPSIEVEARFLGYARKADHPRHAHRGGACARDAGGGRHCGDHPAGVPGPRTRGYPRVSAIRSSNGRCRRRRV